MFHRNRALLLLLLVVLWALVVAGPSHWWGPAKYGAYATGLSTFAVALALLIAAVTFRSDVRDRKVDRTLALHAELTTGDTNDARLRLVRALRELPRCGAGHLVPARYSLFDEGGSLSEHETGLESLPINDRSDLLRFAERARMAWDSGSVDDAMFVELIGRHLTWWNCALEDSNASTGRRALMSVAKRCDSYADRHKDHAYFADWGVTRTRDFGSMTPWATPDECDPTTPSP